MAKNKSQGTGRGSVSTKLGGTRTSDNGNTKKKKNSITSKKPKSKHSKSNNAHIDWVKSLARDNASNSDGTGFKVPSKEDRKRKRELKKNRRMEQLRQKQLQQHEQQQRRSQRSIQENASETFGSQKMKPLANARTSPTGQSSSLSLQQQSRSSLLLKVSKHRLHRLSQILQTIRKDFNDEKATTKTHSHPYYDLPRGRNEKAPRTSYSNSELASSKKRKRRKWNADSIQPLKSDYSGIGMARISMYIEFLDPSYYPKLEEEFREHIPGFFGKQRTKAMKRQMDGNMLWRRLANDKKNNNNSNKKFKGMSADERVQAMIDSSDRASLLG